jgi:enoyl-CoA hydratase/carnithine racemase
VHWRDGENRFRPEVTERWHELLDELEARDGPLALVVTGEGRYFSNGLDLEHLAAHPEAAGPTVAGMERLLGRLLRFPAYTAAAIGGHAFAGGAMLTCAFDLRVMRGDRGWWCLPEVDLGLPLTPAMHAVVTARLPVATAQEAMLTGRRYTGPEAHEAGIVDAVAPEAHVLTACLARAEEMAGKDRSVIAEHKRLSFATAAARCGWDPSPD